jgi:hypothetical protein
MTSLLKTDELTLQVIRMMMAEEKLETSSDRKYLAHCQEKTAEAALREVLDEEMP